MHTIFKAKSADKLKLTTFWDNTSSSQICTIAEASKGMLLMWLKIESLRAIPKGARVL